MCRCEQLSSSEVTSVWWIMMCSVFSCIYWSFLYTYLGSICSNIFSYYSWIICFSIFNLYRYLYMLDAKPLSDICTENRVFFPSLWAACLFLSLCLLMKRYIQLWWILSYLCLLLRIVGFLALYKKSSFKLQL